MFDLGIGFRLKVSAADHRCVVGLYKGATATPAVEWVVGGRTELYFVRPFASAVGYRGPRYYLQGLDLRREVEKLLPVYPAPRDQQRARKLIQGFGGKAPELLPVRRR